MKNLLFILTLCAFASCSQNFDPIEKMGDYDVIWDSPSKNYTGTMPLGNGDISLNVWMEENGDLLFYIGKTDSWGDNSRLLKLGKVRVRMNPAPDMRNSFSQRLNLATGTVEILIGSGPEQVEMNIRVDANNPFIQVDAVSPEDINLTAQIELWRNEPWEPPSYEASDVLLDRSKPDQKHSLMIIEPDQILTGQDGQIGWYHHNIKSVGPEITMDIQGLSGYDMIDPILHRTFGAIIRSEGARVINDSLLQTESGKSHNIRLFVLTDHPSSPEQWLDSINSVAVNIGAIQEEILNNQHKQWWNDFWNRSWIFASPAESSEVTDDDAFAVTQGYVLQRFINACNGRGAFPIKFNGSIFTVPFEGGPGDADYRRWGPGYWWQNTRLPYLSMCTSGDFEMLKPLFNMYAGQVFDISKYRTKEYFDFEGAYFPECINFWGTVFSESYGWTPASEREDKLQVSGWHKWEWVCGPELVWMMLDYYDHTMDEVFLKDTILPVALDVMRFFDNYYSTDEKGKLLMHPSQAVETWWECTNPMPELSGLIAVSERILDLPDNLITEGSKEWVSKFKAKLPDLPLRTVDERLALAPAEKFADKRNSENPELYAVFPFRLVSLEKHNVDWGLTAFEHRWDRGNFGWRQEEIFMAYLGLTEEARTNLVGRALNHDPDSRFPAFWGPNYDWVPDQDHGGILLKAFQAMLFQTEGDKIILVPAWPSDWNVDFKLHAPYQTTVSGSVREGEVVKLKVSPASRKKDVVIWNREADLSLIISPETWAESPVSPLLYSHFIEIGFGYQIAPMQAERFFNRSFEAFPPYNGKSKNSFGFLLPGGDYIKDWSGEAWYHSGYEHNSWYAVPGKTGNPTVITDGSSFFITESTESDVILQPVEGGCGHGRQSIRIINNEEEKWGGMAQDGKWMENGKTYAFTGFIRLRAQGSGLKQGENNESFRVKVWIISENTWGAPVFSEEITITDDYQQYNIEIPYNRPSGLMTFALFIPPGSVVEADAFSLLPEDHFFKWKPETVETVKKLNPGLIRFPGGCFASFYDWKNGVGPYVDRQPEPSYFWGGLNNNDLGTAEFAMLCREVGCEMMLCVNMHHPEKENYLRKSRNPLQDIDYKLPQFADIEKGIANAADWVAYCNLEAGSHPMADLRKAHGYTEPFGVKYWEMDNETIRWMSPEEYARLVVRYSEAMKSVDPEINIGMVTYDFDENVPEMLEIAGHYIDFFADRDDFEDGRLDKMIALLKGTSKNLFFWRHCLT